MYVSIVRQVDCHIMRARGGSSLQFHEIYRSNFAIIAW